jgi:hypothetical protein
VAAVGNAPGTSRRRSGGRSSSCEFDEPARVGMQRIGEHASAGPRSTTSPAYMTCDAVAERLGRGHVVGDEDNRRARHSPQAAEEIGNLALYNVVEIGGRLVGDDEVQLHRHDHGDQRPLLHAARLMRGSGAERARPVGCRPQRATGPAA